MIILKFEMIFDLCDTKSINNLLSGADFGLDESFAPKIPSRKVKVLNRLEYVGNPSELTVMEIKRLENAFLDAGKKSNSEIKLIAVHYLDYEIN